MQGLLQSLAAALLIVLASAAFASAQMMPEQPAPAQPAAPAQQPPTDPPTMQPLLPIEPAILELILPAGAKVTVDGRDVGEERSIKFDGLKLKQTRRVKVTVQLASGEVEQRQVDVEGALRVVLAVGRSPVDRPVAKSAAKAVMWAAFSPDGKRIAVGTEDGSVTIWDTIRGRPIRAIVAHPQAVFSVAFSPDGTQLLTASADFTAMLWDVQTGAALRTFKGHTAGVFSAVFSSDGKQVLTGSSDKTAILWDAATGEAIRTFAGHADEIMGVAISPNGKQIATGSSDKFAAIWETATGNVQASLRLNDTASGVVFSADSAYLAVSSYNNTVTFYGSPGGARLGATRMVNLDLNCVAFSPDDRWAYSGGADGTAKLWDSVSAQMLREFAGHTDPVRSVTTTADGRILLSASRDGTCRLWDVYTGLELAALSCSDGKSWAVVAPDGLFDGSEPGRQMMSLGFAGKLPGAGMDQFFADFHHPGLLAELLRGERPMASVQLGHSLPPVVKIVSPKARVSTQPTVTMTVEVVDRGGGIGNLSVYHNGARLAVPIAVNPEQTELGEKASGDAQQPGATKQFTFKIPLVQRSNRIRVSAANADGSWESIPAELELNYARPLERKSRLFVVAVGAGQADAKPNHAVEDAKLLADLLKSHAPRTYERVDVVPLLDRDASKAVIRDTLLDVAELTQPQDTLIVVLCGRGALLGERLYFAPADLQIRTGHAEDDLRAGGVAVDDVAAALGTTKALNRAIIFDADAVGLAVADAPSSPVEFRLRAAVERMARSQGVFTIAAVLPSKKGSVKAADIDHGLLTYALAAAAGGVRGGPLAGKSLESPDGGNAATITDWFQFAAAHAEPLADKLYAAPGAVQCSSQAVGFSLLTVGK